MIRLIKILFTLVLISYFVSAINSNSMILFTASAQSTNSQVYTQSNDEIIPVPLADTQPTFNGGNIFAFSKWVQSQIIFPLVVKNTGISGRVVYSFVIEKNGVLTNVKILNGLHPLLDNELVRVLYNSPKWNPGTYNGNVSRCSYTLPILFESNKVADKGTNNGFEWVDLGLSVRWATCNIGASNPYGYGDYYSWGELSTYYKFPLEQSSTYGRAINDISSNPSYDAAKVNMKGTWRLPTKDEFQELINKCSWTWSVLNGIYGFSIKSNINNNSIFLPAGGGYMCGSTNPSLLVDLGTFGFYWTSTPGEKNSDSKGENNYQTKAFMLSFSKYGASILDYEKYFGYSIRAVCD